MESIFRTFSAHKHRLMGFENVIGVGIGYKMVGGAYTRKKAICVLVKSKKPLSELPSAQAVPSKIGDHHTDVIEVGEIVLLSHIEKMRPAPPGCSIGHYLITAGTFGCVVVDRKGGSRLMLSNNHVLANMTDGNDDRAQKGDAIFQPGRYDHGTSADLIAHLERWVPIHRDVAAPTCPIAKAVESAGNAVMKMMKPNYRMRFLKAMKAENLVDCALARPVADDLITQEIIDIGVPAGASQAAVGMKVQKSGRTSGLTKGEIIVIGATLKVAMGDTGDATFSDQLVMTSIGEPGDSGSLVLDEDDRAVGLLAAGSNKATICGSIQNVLNLLDINLVVKK